MKISGKVESLVELLRRRVDADAAAPFLTFLGENSSQPAGLDVGQLDRRARAIAGRLHAHAPSGERAVLMFSDGLEFVAAFFGCLYAGVIPAPAFPPRNRRTAPRVQAILNDSEARFCLADAAASERCRGVVEAMPGSAGRIWLWTDSIEPEAEFRWEAPEHSRDSLSSLQYT